MAPAVALLSLCLCLAQSLARDPRAGAGDVPVVQCVATNCSQPCPPLPDDCPSKLIMNCGCCDVCWIYLDEDDTCDTPVLENVICGHDMWCNAEGRCEAIPLRESAAER